MSDIFISYVTADRPWAEWIAWVLEENDYPITTQALDDSSGTRSLVSNVKQALTEDEFVVIVLSQSYITFANAQPDWHLDPEQDPAQVAFKVIPLRIEDCQLPSAWGLPGYVDILDKSETEAEKAIAAVLRSFAQGDISSLTNHYSFLNDQIETAPVDKGLMQSDQSTPSGDRYFDKGQLKLRKRPYTVQGYVESLSDGIGIEMIQIPAGSFWMGSPEDELERLDREGPQHEVNLSAFFMGKYPVTQAEWTFVAALPSVNKPLDPNPSRFEGDGNPVEQVSWSDAVEFCDRLSLHTGRPYRLPTEAEWEYACRAETMTPFHFGETITTDLANYRGNDEKNGSYGRGPKGEYRQRPTPVDYFDITNRFGLCDMHGNVWEWCQDLWCPIYLSQSSENKLTREQKQSTHQVARGGSWYSKPQKCRSASRFHFSPDVAEPDLGFRIICAPV
ncbi:MAG: SUMF1/EgtB/PvdO family nonheme iron enzyme [Leptolyngbya sp. SIO1D8]|nr:SUMF1/EgtB/PvdO family nonheme iron enzyme [Leptolyngbya sp. SIO1D8]